MLAVQIYNPSRPALAPFLAPQQTKKTLIALSALASRHLLANGGQRSLSGQRRSFWWGNHCSSYMSPASRNSDIRRVYRYRFRQALRGKGRCDVKNEELEKDMAFWRNYSQKTLKDIQKMRDIKRRIDQNPYEALFGTSPTSFDRPSFLGAWTRSFLDLGNSESLSSGNKASEKSTDRPKHENYRTTTTEVLEEYEIDPISLKKIPKSHGRDVNKGHASPRPNSSGSSKSYAAKPAVVEPERNESLGSVEAGIRARKQRYAEMQQLEKSQAKASVSEGQQSSIGSGQNVWLHREGFASSDGPGSSKNQPSRSSVDRIQQSARSNLETDFDQIDMSREDMDLLRQVDVKARSSVRKADVSRSSANENNLKARLEEDFAKSSPNQLDETAARNSIEQYKSKEKTTEPTNNSVAEGDLSSDVSVWATKNPLFNSGPASIQERAELGRVAYEKLAQKQKERDLVREIRTIYEEDYGTIDSQHRQADVKSPEVPLAEEVIETESESTVYKILALDPQSQKIISATNASSATAEASERVLSIPEVLMTINSPAKFLPHFAPLQKQGFELVRGSGDVIVFRKMPGGIPSTSQNLDQATTAAPESKNVAPQNTQTESPISKPDKALPQEPTSSLPKVQRQEPVFSGRRLWRHHRRQSPYVQARRPGPIRRAVRGLFWVAGRILLGAFWVAGGTVVVVFTLHTAARYWG